LAASNPSFNRIFVLIHPGSAATYRAVHKAVGGHPITVQYEPADDDESETQGNPDAKVKRIVITSSMRERDPIPLDKRPVYVECCDQQVYLVEGDGRSTMRAFSLKDLNRPDGKFQVLLMRLDRPTHYISFFVTEDSFSVFRKARDLAERWGWSTSWELIGAHEPIEFDSNSGGH
jgi:hypothetical protein